jgi:hypothetical protein
MISIWCKYTNTFGICLFGCFLEFYIEVVPRLPFILTNSNFRKWNSCVAKFWESKDEIVTEEEEERARNENSPTKLVINSQFAIQHEIQIVQECWQT